MYRRTLPGWHSVSRGIAIRVNVGKKCDYAVTSPVERGGDGDFRREEGKGRWRVKYGDAQSNRMMRVSHHLWSFQHIDLITAIQCYSIRPQKVGFPGAKFQCKGNMDGGMRGRSALQKQSRPRIQTSLSGTVRGGKKKGRGVACKFCFARVIIVVMMIP